MKLIKSTILAAVLLATGCATRVYDLAPIATEAQEVRLNYGKQTIIAPGIAGNVTLSSNGPIQRDRRPTFTLTFTNATDRFITIDESAVAVYVDNRAHSMLTTEYLVDEANTAANWRAVALALSAAGNAMAAANAGYQTTYHSGTTSAYAYGSNGTSAYGYGTYSGYSTTYNPVAAQMAQQRAAAQTAALASAMDVQHRADIEFAYSAALKPHSVAPGETYSTPIVIERVQPGKKGAMRNVLFELNIDGELYPVNFGYSRVR